MLWAVLLLACLLAFLQVQVKRQIKRNTTQFVRSCSGSQTLTALEQWTLAVISPNLMMLELPVDCFRTPEPRRVPILSTMLANEWKIVDRASLLPVIEHLQEAGYRLRCAELAEKPADEYLAWDLVRAIWLVWAGLNLDWLSREECATVLERCGRRLQSRFEGWADLSRSYEAGLDIWAREGRVRKLAARMGVAIRTLLTRPDSPWLLTPWRRPLVDTIAE